MTDRMKMGISLTPQEMPEAEEEADRPTPSEGYTEIPPLQPVINHEDSFEITPLRSQEEKVQAATKIKSLFRGHQVRRNTIMPKELEAELNTTLTGLNMNPHDAQNLSRVLAREILESGSVNYYGYGRRLMANTGEYKFYNYNTNKTETISVPADIWVSRNADNLEIEVIAKELLDKGILKEIYKSSAINVLMKTAQHVLTAQDAIVVRILLQNQNHVTRGFKLVKNTFNEEEIKKLKLAGILTRMDRQGKNLNMIEARDALFPEGSFLKYYHKNASDHNKTAYLKIYSDAARALQAFHQKGIVHSDLKPENILVGGTPDKPDGHLIDFDGAVMIGERISVATRTYMDNIADKLKMATPFMDIFAMATLLNFTKVDGPVDPQDNQLLRDKVLEANKNTVAWLRDHAEIINDLRETSLQLRQDAMKELNEAFPVFQQFLDALAGTT